MNIKEPHVERSDEVDLIPTRFSKPMRSIPISDALQSKKLSKKNLEDLQKHISSSSQPDSVRGWISSTPITMTNSNSKVPVTKKRKCSGTLASIAVTTAPKNTLSYSETLYCLGISQVDDDGIIPPAPNHDEVSNLVTEPDDLPLLATVMKNWIVDVEPNEASLVNYLCRCLFQPKLSSSSVYILYEFPSPFKSHDLVKVEKGNEIKYPLVKHRMSAEKSDKLQTPAEFDLRGRSDFVFAASTKFFDADIWAIIKQNKDEIAVPGLSDNLRSCAVAIAVEAKAISSKASLIAAGNQWKSMAYVQMMERISISRVATYVGDENICQYGYLIRGLQVKVLKMSLQWNKKSRRSSDQLDYYFTFPVQTVDVFDLDVQKHLEEFITLHKRLLQWWLGGYIPCYVKDLSDNARTYPRHALRWITTWQEEMKKLMPAITTSEGQPASPSVGAEKSPGDGLCQGTTKRNAKCRTKVKTGKYCSRHLKE